MSDRAVNVVFRVAFFASAVFWIYELYVANIGGVAAFGFMAGFFAGVLPLKGRTNQLRCPNETGSPCDGNACDALGCARIPGATPGRR